MELNQWLPDISEISFTSIVVIIACVAILWNFGKALWNVLVIFLLLCSTYALWLSVEHPERLHRLTDATTWIQYLPEKVKRVWDTIKK